MSFLPITHSKTTESQQTCPLFKGSYPQHQPFTSTFRALQSMMPTSSLLLLMPCGKIYLFPITLPPLARAQQPGAVPCHRDSCVTALQAAQASNQHQSHPPACSGDSFPSPGNPLGRITSILFQLICSQCCFKFQSHFFCSEEKEGNSP